MITLAALPFPNIDPVALQIGPLSIKWYGLAYLAGLLLGWLYVRRLLRRPGSGAQPARPSASSVSTICCSTSRWRRRGRPSRLRAAL